MERAGETLKSALQKSDPFKKNTCTQPDCFICSNGIPVNCRERGIVYELKCNLCEDRRYRGQTSRSSNTRTKEHHDDLTNEKEGSPFYKHKQLFHHSENCSFTVKILARCFGKPSRRLITESVMIEELAPEKAINRKSEWTYTRLNKL